MTVSKWISASAPLLLVATAHAHAHLTAAVPADGSSGKAPEHIVLTFTETARITALTLQRQGEEPRKLTPLPVEKAVRITVPLPKLLPGSYTLSWRVVGEDGHVAPGVLHFTVLEASAAGGGGG
jgi:methionine-rich copper-binding protein CopC